MRLFFCESIPESGLIQLNHRDARHLFKTLRAREGDEIELINGKGVHAEAVVRTKESIEIHTFHRETPPAKRIHLAVAVPRRQKMDQLLRQCTEVGVTTLVPLICERSVSTPDIEADDERFQTLIIESCKQSRNYFMPRTLPSATLNDFIAAHDWHQEAGFLGHPYAADTNQTSPTEARDFWWIVGPEGGFSDAEIAHILAHNIQPVNLSPYILRVETAAILGLGYLQTQFLMR